MMPTQMSSSTMRAIGKKKPMANAGAKPMAMPMATSKPKKMAMGMDLSSAMERGIKKALKLPGM